MDECSLYIYVFVYQVSSAFVLLWFCVLVFENFSDLSESDDLMSESDDYDDENYETQNDNYDDDLINIKSCATTAL